MFRWLSLNTANLKGVACGREARNGAKKLLGIPDQSKVANGVRAATKERNKKWQRKSNVNCIGNQMVYGVTFKTKRKILGEPLIYAGKI